MAQDAAERALTLRERLLGRLAPLSPPNARLAFLQRDEAGGSSGLYLFGWQPQLREVSEEYRLAWRGAVSRSIDAIHNSGWLAGGIEQATVMMVGTQLALNSRPDPEAFGGDEWAASDWARGVGRRWEAWSRNPYECDIRATHSLGHLCAQATRSWFGTGEITGLLRWIKKPGNTHGTKVQILPSTRIPQAAMDSRTVQGLFLDDNGAPTGYIFRNYDPRQPGKFEEVPVKARDRLGRPIVIHLHDSPATVLRGVTVLAPALKIVRQYDQLSDATLTAALVQAIFAATIESDAPTEQLVTMLQGETEQDDGQSPMSFTGLNRVKRTFYEKTKFDLGRFGKVLHLFTGEKLNFHASQHPNSNYESFCRYLLLEIARCLGITYEQLTGDRSHASYSSERMGGAENWDLIQYRRAHIPARLMQMVYETWLEEDIELGNTEVPGGIVAFRAQRAQFCRADWRGPAKPTADDLRTAKANEVKFQNGVISREVWCAEEGYDVLDIDDALLKEQENRDRLGLPPVPPQKAAGSGASPGQELQDMMEGGSTVEENTPPGGSFPPARKQVPANA